MKTKKIMIFLILNILFLTSICYGNANIEGYITIPDHSDNSNVYIYILENGKSTATNSLGYYCFENLNNGTYSLIAEYPGCLPKILRDIELQDSNVSIDFSLEPGDLTQDGMIDLLDRVEITKLWQIQSNDPNWNPFYDLNQDAIIDSSDKNIILNNWGLSSTNSFNNIIPSDSGGVVISDSLLLNIPPGSLPNDTLVSVNKEEEPPFIPQTSSIEVFGSYYDFQPSGLTFIYPITVNINYNENDIPTGANESDLVLLHYEEDSSISVNYCVIDSANNLITAELYSFSGATIGVNYNEIEASPPYPIPTNQTVSYDEDLAYLKPPSDTYPAIDYPIDVPSSGIRSYDYSSNLLGGLWEHDDFWGVVNCPTEIETSNKNKVAYCSVFDNDENRFPGTSTYPLADYIYAEDSEDKMKSCLVFMIDAGNVEEATFEFDMWEQTDDNQFFWGVRNMDYLKVEAVQAWVSSDTTLSMGLSAFLPGFAWTDLKDSNENQYFFWTGDANADPGPDDWSHFSFDLSDSFTLGTLLFHGGESPIVFFRIFFHADDDENRMAGTFVDNVEFNATLQKPTVEANTSTTTAEIDEEINFNGTFSDPNGEGPEGTLSYYEWDFDGDGNKDEWGTEYPIPEFSHSYSSTGTYTARLTVFDNGSPVIHDIDGEEFHVNYASSYDEVEITIETDNQPPNTSFTGGPTGTVNDPEVTFSWDGSDPDGNVVGYYYEMDDSSPDYYTTSSSKTFNVSPGSHTVYVKAKDNDGAVDPTPASRTFMYEQINLPDLIIESAHVESLTISGGVLYGFGYATVKNIGSDMTESVYGSVLEWWSEDNILDDSDQPAGGLTGMECLANGETWSTWGGLLSQNYISGQQYIIFEVIFQCEESNNNNNTYAVQINLDPENTTSKDSLDINLNETIEGTE